MERNLSKEARRARDADLLARSKATRLLWDSNDGPAIRVGGPTSSFPPYAAKPIVRKGSQARKLTEAEDNAIARAKRRRQNKKLRGWLPHCKR